MKMDRVKAKQAFADYVNNYDSEDDKTRLKIEHTYRVSELCESIAQELGLSVEETDLAWLLGLLHDVGRFEQLKQFGTFEDAVSVDHAALGADILFQEGRIRDYVQDKAEDTLLETAVRNHNVYRLPEGLTQRMKIFCQIIRDADKIDILRVNMEFPFEEIYNTTTQELKQAEITPAVLKSFYEEHATLRSIRRTVADNVVSHISLVFELVYPVSFLIVKEQGYLEKLLQFQSDNPATAEQLLQIGDFMRDFLQLQCSFEPEK